MSPVTRKVILSETILCITLICLIWLDEWLDLPFLVLGARQTPFNYREAIFESILIVSVFLPMIIITYRILRKIDRLARLIPSCSICRNVNTDLNLWNMLENCVRQYADQTFVDDICLKCLKKYHPEMYRERTGQKPSQDSVSSSGR